MMYISAGVGLALLALCADLLVRGAVGLANRLGISKLVIGLTVVAFGTSSPELVAALEATLRGAEGIAVGNVVGSNIANLLLILGIAAAIRPIACTTRTIGRDGMVMVAATLIFLVLAMSGMLERWHGIAMLAGLGVYLYNSYRLERREPPADAVHALEAAKVTGVPVEVWKSTGLVLVGLAGIIGGAELLIDGAIEIAFAFDISEAVIGLTLVALGTSLPELATVIVASLRAHGDVALGNVLGSNIFNLLGVAGGISIIQPLTIPAQVVSFDLWVMGAITVLVVPIMLTGRRISRAEGAVLGAFYALYIAFQFDAIRTLFV